MLDIPDDIKAFTASLTDAEAIQMAEAIEAEERAERWDEIVSAFPASSEQTWPYPIEPVLEWRRMASAALDKDPSLRPAAFAWYAAGRPAEFTEHWGITYDPRNGKGARRHLPRKLPMLLFPRQRELFDFLLICSEDEHDGLIEKARDMGATWVCCFFSVWLWLFHPESAVGWGSRKEDLVDRIGDPKSVFDKIRTAISALPPALQPKGFSPRDHMTHMKIVNPENGSTIAGEAGAAIGRGGRTGIYFKDESAHYEHPDSIEAALGDNTNVQIDISSVNGPGNVFHRRREAGQDWVAGAELDPERTAIFVMDWRDHPGKDQVWYDRRRAKAESEGLLHNFQQEVDRNYLAAVAGVIIPADWVHSAIDAHIVLGIEPGGMWRGALDVADGDNPSGDANADAWFQGIVLREVDSWGARDTGETTRRFLGHAEGKGLVEAGYDCIGVGSGVKAEANRLSDEGQMPPRVRLVPWNAAASPLDPTTPIIADDADSPLNGDFYDNLKAQAWWRTRGKFERTHRAVQAHLGKGPAFTWEPDDLISIDSRIPLLRQLEKELSQPTAAKGRRMKLVVNKTPEGTRSPNLADAVIMADNPVSGLKPVITVAKNQFECAPFKVPGHFRKGYAMIVSGQTVAALWGAHDPDADILYFTTEYIRDYAEPGVHAQAIIARGRWIPGTFDCDASNLKHFDELMRLYHGHGLPILSAADRAAEAGIADLQQRISTGRLKVFSTCQGFFTDYRNWRRDDDGRIVGGGLMNCATQLARAEAIRRMAVEPNPHAAGATPGVNLYA